MLFASSYQQKLTNYFQDSIFYSHYNLQEKKMWREAEKRVLSLIHQAFQRVPAYRDVLQKQKIQIGNIKTIEDVVRLPILTKENYILHYSPQERNWDGNFEQMNIISSSSGTTGEPLFWPRNLSHEIDGALAHEYIFNSVLGVGGEKILFINGFALGNWIAGMFTHNCLNLLSWKGYSVTMASSGYSLESVMDILKKIAPHFSKIVLVGHTPFLKEIVDVAREMNINLKSLSPQFLGTGQAISEKWRLYIEEQLGSSGSFFNLYGSADASLMGFETPNTVFWRKVFSDSSELKAEFFGRDRLPSLYEYDPRLTFFEEVKNELVITKDSGCPLIRYNIHDEGGVFTQSKFKTKIMNYYPKENERFPTFPIVYLFGRDKFMVKLYGANIYTEHIQHVLEHDDIHPLITGRFHIQIDQNEQLDSVMVCRIELGKFAVDNVDFLKQVQQIFIHRLRQINSEYDFVFRSMGEKVYPKIIFHKHGDEKYFPSGKVKKTS